MRGSLGRGRRLSADSANTRATEPEQRVQTQRARRWSNRVFRYRPSGAKGSIGSLPATRGGDKRGNGCKGSDCPDDVHGKAGEQEEKRVAKSAARFSHGGQGNFFG